MKTLKCIEVSVLYDGVVVIDCSRTISLKELKTYEKIKGPLFFNSSLSVTLPKLKECGNILFKKGILNLPKLKKADYIDVNKACILYVPKLIECRSLYSRENIGLPSLKKCRVLSLSLWNESGHKMPIDLSNLHSIENLDVSGCAIDLIKIKSLDKIEMGSNVDIYAPNLIKANVIKAIFKENNISAPKLKFANTIIAGNKASFDSLEACDWLSFRFNSEFSSPKLKYVGQLLINCSPEIHAPKLKFVGKYDGDLDQLKCWKKIKIGERELLEEIGSKYVWADGILSPYETKIAKLGITFYMGSNVCVVSNGELNAHGSNYARALESLRYKKENAIKKKNESLPREKREVLPGLIIGDIKPETEFTLEEAVTVYRTLTGACKYGCEDFIKNLPEEIKNKAKFTYAEMKELTVGHYGHEDLV